MPSAGAVRAGGAFVEVFTKETEFEKGLRAAEDGLRGFANNIVQTGAAVTSAGVAFVAPFALAIRQFVTFGDQLAKDAIRIGETAENTSKLAYAAKVSGTDIDELRKAIIRMQVAVDAANRGSREGQAALAEFGLTAADLAGKTPTEQLLTFADGLRGIQDPAARTAAVVQLFGKNAAAIVPFLQEGSAGIQRLFAEAEKLGAVLSSDNADAAQATSDAFDRMKASATGLAFSVGGALAPSLIFLADATAAAAKWVNTFATNHPVIVNAMAAIAVSTLAVGTAILAAGGALKAFIGISASLRIVITLFRELTVAVAAFRAIGSFTAIGGLIALGPQLLVIGAILTGIYLVFKAIQYVWDYFTSSAEDVPKVAAPDTEAQRQQIESAEAQLKESLSAEKRLRDVKIQSIREVLVRDVEAIKAKYDDELDRAKENHASEDALAKLAEARDIEIANRIAEARMAGAKLQADVENRIRDIRVNGIQDALQRDLAANNNKYDDEEKRLREQGAASQTLFDLNKARVLEAQQIIDRHAREVHAVERNAALAIQLLQIEGIENTHDRALAEIDARADAERDAAIAAGEQWRVALINAQQQARIESENIRNQRRVDEANKVRGETIEELRLRTTEKGIKLQKDLLELEHQRALQKAREAGENLDLVNEEYALRLKLLEAQERARFQAEAIVGFGAQSVTGGVVSSDFAKRSADAAEQSLRYQAQILDELRHGLPHWGP